MRQILDEGCGLRPCGKQAGMRTDCIHSGMEDKSFSRKMQAKFPPRRWIPVRYNVIVGGDDLQFEHEPVSR